MVRSNLVGLEVVSWLETNGEASGDVEVIVGFTDSAPGEGKSLREREFR